MTETAATATLSSFSYHFISYFVIRPALFIT